MQLALDAGNSSIKFGLFDGDDLILKGKIPNGTSIELAIEKNLLTQVGVIVTCSVLNAINILGLPDVKCIQIGQKSNFPFTINYESPETLGIDRVVACSGAYKKGQNHLVIDAGSCITYDFLDSEKGYLGGAISAGLEMRFKAMNNFTEKLPLISKFNNNPQILGTSTNSCLKSGAINGIVYEIEGFINHFSSITSNLDIYLTGGDAIFLGAELKSTIFADQNLVLKGLNSLITLNEE